VLQRLAPEDHGLVWRRARLVVAHPTDQGPTAVALDQPRNDGGVARCLRRGDGDAWPELYALWRRIEQPFMEAFTAPFPTVQAAARLAAAVGPRGALRLARMALLAARRFSHEHFRGAGGALLLAGNALHADLTPESASGGMFGWILCSLGQRHGFPTPEGGAGRLTDALVRRLRSRGGDIRCASRVVEVIVHRRRAVAVRLADGTVVDAPGGVIAGTGAPQLYLQLVGGGHLPPQMVAELRRFQYDNSTIKVDWALEAPIRWADEAVREAGTIHLAESMDLLTQTTTDLERQVIPKRPFLVLGQYAAADSTRAPDGADTPWAYTHVPQHARADALGELQGGWDAEELERFAGRMEDEIERFAPGFRQLVLDRHIAGPHELEAANANLVGGAINGGTAKLHQQLVFRPVPGLGRSETPIRGLFLGSASAHPGGGVHGAPGSNAARALLAHRHLVPARLLDE
jgi:phytoene dehydrogenase-like protein